VILKYYLHYLLLLFHLFQQQHYFLQQKLLHLLHLRIELQIVD